MHLLKLAIIFLNILKYPVIIQILQVVSTLLFNSLSDLGFKWCSYIRVDCASEVSWSTDCPCIHSYFPLSLPLTLLKKLGHLSCRVLWDLGGLLFKLGLSGQASGRELGAETWRKKLTTCESRGRICEAGEREVWGLEKETCLQCAAQMQSARRSSRCWGWRGGQGQIDKGPLVGHGFYSKSDGNLLQIFEQGSSTIWFRSLCMENRP